MGALDYHMTLFDMYNQENVQLSPDPFPRERVGSGDETNLQTPASSNSSLRDTTPTMLTRDSTTRLTPRFSGGDTPPCTWFEPHPFYIYEQTI